MLSPIETSTSIWSMIHFNFQAHAWCMKDTFSRFSFHTNREEEMHFYVIKNVRRRCSFQHVISVFWGWHERVRVDLLSGLMPSSVKQSGEMNPTLWWDSHDILFTDLTALQVSSDKQVSSFRRISDVCSMTYFIYLLFVSWPWNYYYHFSC